MKPNPDIVPASGADLINILIVDDEPGNLVVLETVLDDPSYRLVRAESAEQALLALLAEDFALLILDIGMPVVNGLELAQIVKQRKKTAAIPIIFLTAYYNEDEHVLEGYDSGAVDYIHKPVNAAILRAKVAVFADLHRKNLALLEEVRLRQLAEEALRALTHRVVQDQEKERGSVALDLHDNVTQMLCAILVRSQTLADKLSAGAGAPEQDAIKLRDLLGEAAGEVERISRNLRPSVLEHLGLPAVLRATSAEFTERTGMSVKLDCAKMEARLPINIEMALYRILQEALTNVERHARSRQVTVGLTQRGGFVQLNITDDGAGFDPGRHTASQNGRGGLGLLAMRERATSVGGDFKIRSRRCTGTEIEVCIPLGKAAGAGGAAGSRT